MMLAFPIKMLLALTLLAWLLLIFPKVFDQSADQAMQLVRACSPVSPASMADSSKTEKPTGRRLERARKEGQFVSSRELVAAGQFLVFLAIVQAWFPGWLSGMKEMLGQALTGAFHADLDMTTSSGHRLGADATRLRSALGFGGLDGRHNVGPAFGDHADGTQPEEVDSRFHAPQPGGKIKQMARQGPSAVLQAALMLVVFGATIYLIAKQNAELFLSLPFASLEVGLQKVGSAMKDLLWKAAAVFLVFGVVDLFRQRRRFRRTCA